MPEDSSKYAKSLCLLGGSDMNFRFKNAHTPHVFCAVLQCSRVKYLETRSLLLCSHPLHRADLLPSAKPGPALQAEHDVHLGPPSLSQTPNKVCTAYCLLSGSCLRALGAEMFDLRLSALFLLYSCGGQSWASGDQMKLG